MEPFLSQVARHYYSNTQIGKYVFVFPNRRSMSFFRHYLSLAVKDITLNVGAVANGGRARPLIVPKMYTFGDFMYACSGASASDRVTLLLRLFDCYRKVGGPGNADSLDEFIFWGDVILKDFNDVDNYMVDPKAVFTNVTEFRQLEDTSYSYMTDDQLEAVKAFVHHFKEGGQMKFDPSGEGIKSSFLQIWEILYPLYNEFRRSLMDEGLFYSGMINRDLAERLSEESVTDILSTAFPDASKFVFVGLNDIDKCGKTVLTKMHKAGVAEFCWDYSSDMIKDAGNKSTFFMKDNLTEFKPSFDIDPAGVTVPRINVVAVPSGIGQVKYLPKIFSEISQDISKVGDLVGGKDCAVVLPDENLLMPLLNTIPEGIKDINVTMGVPLSSSAIYSLMKDVAELQFHLRKGKEGMMFYHRPVWNILKSPVMNAVIRFEKENGDDAIEGLLERLNRQKRYYIPHSWFQGSTLLETVFKPVITDIALSDASQIKAFEEYLLGVIAYLAPRLPDNLSTEKEYARKYWGCIMRLRENTLPVKPSTFAVLLERVLSTESVAFEGEPLKGLQMMGPLETRALDFNNLIILSCNEGVFPSRGSSPSFIPPSLRVGFGMPTYEYDDAVAAYNFYRMIQRPSNVWLLYDTRTEKMLPGEESRFIKQLSYHFKVNMKRMVAEEGLNTAVAEDFVQKPADIAQRMKEITLSATSIETYLGCPTKFYYTSVEKLKPKDEVAETLDNAMLGVVYHGTMQALYLGGIAMNPGFSLDKDNIDEHVGDGSLVPLKEITLKYIGEWLKRKDEIRLKVRSLIEEQLNIPEVSGRDLVIEDIIVKYVLKTLAIDKAELEARGLDSFKVLGLEKECHWKFGEWRFKGFVDRVDSFGGVMRVVDYKTGKVTENDCKIDDSNAREVAEKLFGEDVRERPKIAFQLFLYDMFMEKDPLSAGKELYNSIYSTGDMFTNHPVTVKISQQFVSIVRDEKLPAILKEMSDPDVPYRRTSIEDQCKFCDFKMICGRNPKKDN
ncbi:MAG: PD-(D/E)XK nuclease family protein [Bacteroidales bacterium]|nr:PD-(D/E)XK nuclease family protein [Bacteroidales bacterium]